MAEAVAIGTSVAGLVFQGYGINEQIKAQKAAAEAQKKAAEENAALLERNAAAIERQTMDDASRFRKEGQRFLSTQEAAVASSGVELEGSPLLALQETERALREDERRLIQNGILQAQTEREKARVTRRTGQLWADVARYQQTATLLSGLGGMAGQLSSLGWKMYEYTKTSPKSSTTQPILRNPYQGQTQSYGGYGA